jgi:hypothetical protein
LLNGMELAVGCETFDGGDFASIGHHCEKRAGLHRAAIEEDGACTTVGGVAADVCAGEVEMLAKEFDEKGARFGEGFARFTVDAEMNEDFFSVRHIRVRLPRSRRARDARQCRVRA